MKAAVMHEFGDPSVLRYEDVALPEVGPGNVLMKVAAVSVNNLDLKLRSGGDHRRPTLPHVLGWDPAGTVAEIGSDVTDLSEGQRVVFKGRIPCGTCPDCAAGGPSDCKRTKQLGLDVWGAYAEFISVPAGNLRPFPPSLSFAEASVVFRHFPQAFNLLEKAAELQSAEWILVMGAAGGLGSCLVQVAKLLGANVIAGAGSDERVASCIENGADFAVNYRTSDLAAEVMRITDGRGVDVVAENIGDPAIWPGAFRSMARSARLVTVGGHGGGVVEIDVNQLYMKQQRIIGTAGSTPHDIENTVKAAAEGKIHAVIGKVLPLEEAAEAHRLAEDRGAIGKVMLAP